MNTPTAPRVLSLVPGRARVHFPVLPADDVRGVESGLRRLDGVFEVRANALTGNVLIQYDPRLLCLDRLLLMRSWETTQPEAIASDHGEELSDEDMRPGVKSAVVRGVTRGVLGHAAVDVVFYGTTASAYAIGWTWLAPVAAVHALIDVFVWGLALLPVVNEVRRRDQASMAKPNRSLSALSTATKVSCKSNPQSLAALNGQQ